MEDNIYITATTARTGKPVQVDAKCDWRRIYWQSTLASICFCFCLSAVGLVKRTAKQGWTKHNGSRRDPLYLTNNINKYIIEIWICQIRKRNEITRID